MRPADGWPAAPKEADLTLGRLSPDRRRLLQNRGMLALRVPRPPLDWEEWFNWLLEPPDELGNCTWYIDGSMLDGEWRDFRAVGFAIVIVSCSQELLAYGNGCTPAWCGTAAAAEAWALFVALSLCPSPPTVKTDCLALLHTAEGGLARATDASRPLARIWAAIGNVMDGDIYALVADRHLTWMPAHQSLATVGSRTLSDGVQVSVVDWRANRLADALAKQAAVQRKAPMAITRLLNSGRAATRHAAALLGWVTHSANNCIITCTLPDGTMVQRSCRDAQQPQFPKRRSRPAVDKTPQLPPPSAPLPEQPAEATCTLLMGAGVSSRRSESARQHTADVRAEQEWHKRRRIAEIAAASRPAVGKVSGAERLEQLQRRVRARIAERST